MTRVTSRSVYRHQNTKRDAFDSRARLALSDRKLYSGDPTRYGKFRELVPLSNVHYTNPKGCCALCVPGSLESICGNIQR